MVINRMLIEINNKGRSDEISEGKEGHIIENWKKGDPCYKGAKSLAELCLCPSIF